VNLAFVDVPGHERFVRNMLAGAGGIDMVMLVVAADESVMPQTREHFHICRLLEVPAGVIVLTKSDAADAEMVELAGMEVRELVAGSFLEKAAMVAVSSKTGQGLEALRDVLASLASGLEVRRIDGAARLPVDRVFSVKGFGTVVTGTLVSGRIRQDDELRLMPADLAIKARGLQVHGHSEGVAEAGRRVAVNVGGVDLTQVARGDTLCTPGAFEPTRRVDVRLDLLGDAGPLRHAARIRFHQGTTEVLGRVALAGTRPASSSPVVTGGEAATATSPEVSTRASEIAPGASGYARIRFEGPAVLTRGDRFIMRAYSPAITIGGGVVLDPHPPRSPIRNAAAAIRFARLDAAGTSNRDDSAVLSFVDERGPAGLRLGELVSRAGLGPADAHAVEQRLTGAGNVSRVGHVLVSPVVLQDLAARLVAALGAHHKAEPLSEGMPREEARERLFRNAAAPVFDEVVAKLAADGRITGRDRLALAGHQLSLSPEEARAREVIEQMFQQAGLAPPDPSLLHAGAGLSPAVVERVTNLLVRQKRLVKIDALLFHADALSRLRVEVKALKGAEGSEARVDVAAFKLRYGITRKYAIPLLEYLDRERVTRRVGDARIVL
jgi:selenocysteine-specific elongation factor